MKKNILIVISCMLVQFSYSQISEGNWLVGGSGSFSAYSTNQTFVSPASTQNIKGFRIQFSPALGYFVKDKFAVGLKPTLYYERGRGGDAFAPDGTILGSGGELTSFSFAAGTFARYYWLDLENPVNLLVETSYQHSIASISNPKHSFNSVILGVGPVIYFNSSVGVEFLVNYNALTRTTRNTYKEVSRTIQLAIGLQIHLEK